MYKKIFLALSLTLLCQTSFADKCPSVADIKGNTLHGWKTYDSEEKKQLSHQRLTHFKNTVEHFVLAEWVNSRGKNTIHCYYSDNNGSTLEAYIAKDHFIPVNNHHYWYQVSGYIQCAAGAAECAFSKQAFSEAHLAKK